MTWSSLAVCSDLSVAAVLVLMTTLTLHVVLQTAQNLPWVLVERSALPVVQMGLVGVQRGSLVLLAGT